MSIGENLKRIRRDRGWTQGELADRCDVRLGQISKIERNETDPKLSTIYSLMNAMECSPNALLIDVEKASLDSLLAIALERVQRLPEKDKKILLTIIDKYCIAMAMQELQDKTSFFGISRVTGRTQEMGIDQDE